VVKQAFDHPAATAKHTIHATTQAQAKWSGGAHLLTHLHALILSSTGLRDPPGAPVGPRRGL